MEEHFDSVSVELWAASSGVTFRHCSPLNKASLINSAKNNRQSDDISISTIIDHRKTTSLLPVVDTVILETFVTNFIINETEELQMSLDVDQVSYSSVWTTQSEQLVYLDQPRLETIRCDDSCCVSVYQETSSLTTTTPQKNFAVDFVTVYDFAEVFSFFSDVIFVPVRRSSTNGVDQLSLVVLDSSKDSVTSLPPTRDVDVVDRCSVVAVAFGDDRQKSTLTDITRAVPLKPIDGGQNDVTRAAPHRLIGRGQNDVDDGRSGCISAVVSCRQTKPSIHGLFAAYLPQPPMTWTWASRTPSFDTDFRHTSSDLHHGDSTWRPSDGTRQQCFTTDKTIFHFQHVSPVVEQLRLTVTVDIFTLVT